MDEADKNWKLKLRYGKRTTPYTHYTVLAEGLVAELTEGLSCPPGSAWMAMKNWASSPAESAAMVRAIGKEIGFTVTGRVHVYETEPVRSPKNEPYGYDITFTPFDSDGDEGDAT